MRQCDDIHTCWEMQARRWIIVRNKRHFKCTSATTETLASDYDHCPRLHAVISVCEVESNCEINDTEMDQNFWVAITSSHWKRYACFVAVFVLFVGGELPTP